MRRRRRYRNRKARPRRLTYGGRYKRWHPPIGVNCLLLPNKLDGGSCLHIHFGSCDDCIVLCRKKRIHPTRKCNLCKSKFICWTGEVDSI